MSGSIKGHQEHLAYNYSYNLPLPFPFIVDRFTLQLSLFVLDILLKYVIFPTLLTFPDKLISTQLIIYKWFLVWRFCPDANASKVMACPFRAHPTHGAQMPWQKFGNVAFQTNTAWDWWMRLIWGNFSLSLACVENTRFLFKQDKVNNADSAFIFLIIQSQNQWSGWSGRRRWPCLVWSLLER